MLVRVLMCLCSCIFIVALFANIAAESNSGNRVRINKVSTLDSSRKFRICFNLYIISL